MVRAICCVGLLGLVAALASATPAETEQQKPPVDLLGVLSKAYNLPDGVPAPTPLKDAIEHIAFQMGITLLIDEEAYKAEGIQEVAAQPVRLPKIVGLRLRTVLRLLTNQINGTFL